MELTTTDCEIILENYINEQISALFNSGFGNINAMLNFGTHNMNTAIRFFLKEEKGSDLGYLKWKDAIKIVARQRGVPHKFRKKLWLTLSEKYLATLGIDWKRKEELCFKEWNNEDDEFELVRQIELDLPRTGCNLFSGAHADVNQLMLKRLLLTYARWNTSIGYCQGLHMLAAIILDVMEKSEQNSLKVMIYIIECILPDSYFNNNMRGLLVDEAVFLELFNDHLPSLSKHMNSFQGIEANHNSKATTYDNHITTPFSQRWFLTLFSTCLPRDTVLRIWDLLLLGRDEGIFCTALAIWEGLEGRILLEAHTIGGFYCLMENLMSDGVLDYDVSESNNLIKRVVNIPTFPFGHVEKLRQKYKKRTEDSKYVMMFEKFQLPTRVFNNVKHNMTGLKTALTAPLGIPSVFKSPRGSPRAQSPHGYKPTGYRNSNIANTPEQNIKGTWDLVVEDVDEKLNTVSKVELNTKDTRRYVNEDTVSN
jgi:hypothetical protein